MVNIKGMNAVEQVEFLEKQLGFVTFSRPPKYWLKTGSKRLNRVFGSEQLGIPYGKEITLAGKQSCLIGETLIDLPRDLAKYPNGVAIEELVGTKPYLYAFDVRAKKFVLARASSVHQSGSQVPVYKITFKPWRQNMRKVGLPTSIIATGDHKFFLRASPGQNYQATVFNGYKKLKDLKPGDRLLPLCRELSRYSKLVNVLDGSMEQEHRLILRFLYGNRGMEFHGHHKNGEKFDNRIKNLEWKKQGEHLSYHAKEANGNGGYLGWQNHSGIHPRGMLGKKQSANMLMQ